MLKVKFAQKLKTNHFLVKDLQRFVPELKRSDVMRGPAGVRAQAMNYEGKSINFAIIVFKSPLYCRKFG